MASRDAAEASEQPPVAGPSSERLDHAQNGGVKDILDDEDRNEDNGGNSDDDSDADQDSDDDEDLSGISEGSMSGDEEDDYEDIVQANEDAQSGKKKSGCSLYIIYTVLGDC